MRREGKASPSGLVGFFESMGLRRRDVCELCVEEYKTTDAIP